MEKNFRDVINQVKGIKLDHIQEKASQFGDKAKKAVNDIDFEGLNLKKQEIGTKLSEFRDKARLKLEQIEKEARQKKIDRDIEKARKIAERKRIREAFKLKVVNFLKTTAKVCVLIVLVLVFINIVFSDEIKRFKIKQQEIEQQEIEQQRKENQQIKKVERWPVSWEVKNYSEVSNDVNKIYNSSEDVEKINSYCKNKTYTQDNYEKCMYMAGKEIARKILRDN